MFQIILRTIQHYHLLYLITLCHTQHILILLLLYQNPLNLLMDGLDHNYAPEEYLQHIEARVTFSLGLQPTLEHEYKFWHARRMVFIQCSLTSTALSWYIRLNDTYKHDWHAFVQAFKKQFSSQKNAYYAQVEALNSTKKIMKQYVILHSKFNSSTAG